MSILKVFYNIKTNKIVEKNLYTKDVLYIIKISSFYIK